MPLTGISLSSWKLWLMATVSLKPPIAADEYLVPVGDPRGSHR